MVKPFWAHARFNNLYVTCCNQFAVGTCVLAEVYIELGLMLFSSKRVLELTVLVVLI